MWPVLVALPLLLLGTAVFSGMQNFELSHGRFCGIAEFDTGW